MQLKKILIRSVITILAIASLISILIFVSLQHFYDDWVDQAINSVKTKLEDPNSAKFRNVHVVWGQMVMVCGEVSLESSSNHDSSYLKFMTGVPPTPELTFIEERGKTFNDDVWQVCR